MLALSSSIPTLWNLCRSAFQSQSLSISEKQFDQGPGLTCLHHYVFYVVLYIITLLHDCVVAILYFLYMLTLANCKMLICVFVVTLLRAYVYTWLVRHVGI